MENHISITFLGIAGNCKVRKDDEMYVDSKAWVKANFSGFSMVQMRTTSQEMIERAVLKERQRDGCKEHCEWRREVGKSNRAGGEWLVEVVGWRDVRAPIVLEVEEE